VTHGNKEDKNMLIINIVLALVAALLLFGVIGEKDGLRQQNITIAFVAVIVLIISLNRFFLREDKTMEYKPKVITGKVTGTGWPIDGHVLWFSQWDYDNRENWHLYGWEDSEDEAVMQTVFQTETEAGLCLFDTLEKFTENWKAKKWEPQGSFCLPLDKVEVLEVKQEESTNNTREQLRAHGFDLTPRKQTDRGGIICLPLDKNLNGDVQAKHPDWEPVECPTCGRKCWKHPEAGRLAKEQGAKMLCTECAIKAGLLSPFRKEGPNRAQRRRAKRERRK
jgi:hypothetical protein